MKAIDLLKGKKAKVMTDAKVPVELVIKDAIEEKHSLELEPATKENDWWPASRDWTTIEVTFENGYKKSYRSLSDIELVD